mgnify:FL=1|jgi:glycerophosphodiester phosphodiesterase|tara:strand:+ start:263 stop:3658 length:3396 start_codon:yes stop_codon:yes gene_type:complete
MVKFARRLESEAFPSWAAHYIDYRALKRVVYEAKDGADGEEGARRFLNALRDEIVKANGFYATKERALRERLDALETDIRSDSVDATALRRAKKTLVREFYPELSELREFVVLNYTAVVKAVKKFNKNCNRSENAVSILSESPMFYSLGLAKLVTRTEMLAVHAAPTKSAKVLEDSICPVCEEVLSNPVVLPTCRHKFCFKCIINSAPSASTPLITTASVTNLNDIANLAETGSPIMKTPASKVALFPGRCPVCRAKEDRKIDGRMFKPDSNLDELIRNFNDRDLDTDADELDADMLMTPAAAGSASDESASDVQPEHPVPTLRKVLLVAVAGCRVDAMLTANTPTLKSFIRGNKNACFSLDMNASAMRCSTSANSPMLPILTGQSVSVLKAIDEDEDATLSSIYDRLKETRSWIKGACAIGEAEDLDKIIRKETKSLLASSVSTDAEASEAIAKCLAEPTTPDMLLLHLGDIQNTGFRHGFGPHVDTYMDAIESADRKLAEVIAALRARQSMHREEDWLVVITSPSGGTCRHDMPAGMQGQFDAYDWSDGGGRQLRSNGVSGLLELPQHSAGWVLIESGPRVEMSGELLPSPCDTDIAPTILDHFGVATRREWAMDGEDMLAFRRREAQAKDPTLNSRLKNTKKGFEQRRVSHPIIGSTPFPSHLPGLFEPAGCAVIGHRGLQANRASGAGIRENTLASFNAASAGGAEWCEFDVQVTADGVPVAWHDDVVIIRRGLGPLESFSVREIDWADLRELSRAARATAARASNALGVEKAVPLTTDDEDDEDDDDYDEDDNKVTFYRVFGGDLEPQPWVMEVEDEIPTLAQILGNTPKELGFNIELKFDEENSCETRRLVAELRAILAVCMAQPSRRIVFSSFDPDAALLMRAIQGSYPVMILTDAEPHHVDPRRRSVAAAMEVALEGGLCGVVSNVKAIISRPSDATDVRDSGLLLATYGEGNDDVAASSTQVELGVFGIITDAVPAVAKKFNATTVNPGNLAPALAPLVSPSVDAASAAAKLGKLELDMVMRSNWYRLSDEGQQSVVNTDGSANSSRPSSPKYRPRRDSYEDAASDNADAFERPASPDSFQVHKVRNNDKWTGFPQFQRGRRERKPSPLTGLQPVTVKTLLP